MSERGCKRVREAGPPSSSLPRPIFFLPCYSGKEKGLEGKEGGGKRKRLSSLSSSNKQRGGKSARKKHRQPNATQLLGATDEEENKQEPGRGKEHKSSCLFLSPSSFVTHLIPISLSSSPRDAPRTIVPLPPPLSRPTNKGAGNI